MIALSKIVLILEFLIISDSGCWWSSDKVNTAKPKATVINTRQY